MKKLLKQAMKQAMNTTNRINAMKDKIAKEWYGCRWYELDYDDRESATYEAYDRLNNKNNKWLENQAGRNTGLFLFKGE